MAVLSVQGPNSRALLQSLTTADMSNEAFPFGTSQIIDLGYARVRASRVTYVGELGWELYIPTEFATGVFDVIVAAGAEFGLRLCGYHALNSLRMEKGYRHWGHDISPDDTPLEAGLGFVVAWNKPGGFIGREALLAQKEAGLRSVWRSSACTTPSGCSTTTSRSGAMASSSAASRRACTATTSTHRWAWATWRTPMASPIATGCWRATYEIEVAGDRVGATVSLEPFYDPKSARVRT